MSDGKAQASRDVRPLRYIVEILRQITQTLTDFGLTDEAHLIQKARVDIEAKLPHQNDIEWR